MGLCHIVLLSSLSPALLRSKERPVADPKCKPSTRRKLGLLYFANRGEFALPRVRYHGADSAQRPILLPAVLYIDG